MEAITLRHDATAVTLRFEQRGLRWFRVATDGNGNDFETVRVMSWEWADMLNEHIDSGWQEVE